jgi:bifunctional DNA-binding transcriptional regulator/antitoxin component of YhaV-PrlF toxin-antitoxin module
VLETAPQARHIPAVTTIVQLDASNRIVLPRDLRRAAGVPRGQKLKASATPSRIVLEIVPTAQGKVIRRGKLKVWTGDVPSTPLAEAVEAARHYKQSFTFRPRGARPGNPHPVDWLTRNFLDR